MGSQFVFPFAELELIELELQTNFKHILYPNNDFEIQWSSSNSEPRTRSF